MKANIISIDHAKSDKLFYFVANAIIYRESDGRCLILKRSDREKVHPGKYCVPGGKMEWNDLDLRNPTRMNGDVYDFEGKIEELLIREVEEEAGVTLKLPLQYINNVVFVRPDGIPVVMIKFAACYDSGEIILEDGSFTDYAWVDAEEVKQYPCIQGIPEEIANTIRLLSK